MNSRAVIALIYLFITFVCVSVAAWSTYYGFGDLLKGLALPYAAVISAGLLACDVAILDRRRNGQSIWSVLFVLLVFTAASAACNFNYFYTNFIRDEIVDRRLADADRNYEDNMSAITQALNKDKTFAEFSGKIEQLVRNLKNEINDPTRKGWGVEALKVKDEILSVLKERKLAIQPQQFPKADDPFQKNEAAYQLFKQRVDEVLASERSNDQTGKALQVVEQSKAKKSELVKRVATERDFSAKIAAIKELETETLAVDRAIKPALASVNQQLPGVLKATSYEGIELGSIPNAIRSGFVERPNVYVTAFAAITAFMIDLIPLIVALFLVRPQGHSGMSEQGDFVTAGSGRKQKGFKHPPILRS